MLQLLQNSLYLLYDNNSKKNHFGNIIKKIIINTLVFLTVWIEAGLF